MRTTIFIHKTGEKCTCPHCDQFNSIFFSVAANCDFPILCDSCFASMIRITADESTPVTFVDNWPNEIENLTFNGVCRVNK